MYQRVVDDRGHVWDAGAPELHERLRERAPDPGLAVSAVLDLGFIELQRKSDTLHVACRPDLVTPVALIALFYAMLEDAPRRLTLKIYVDDWQHEICQSVDEAVRRLEQIVTGTAPASGVDAADPAPLRRSNTLH